MMIGRNAKIVAITETGAEMIEEIGTMISVKHLSDRPRTKRATRERGATRIIIIGTIGGIAIVTETTGIGVGIAAIGTGTGGILGMTGQRIVIETNARVITRIKIVRGQGHDRGIAFHRRSGR